MVKNTPHPDILTLTTEIVSAHLSGNQVSLEEIPLIIQSVYRTLLSLGNEGDAMIERPQPAVPVKKSVMPDYIICLEDGKKLKMLKRHLKAVYGMTPAEYRERWGLPPDYPMVAPSYAERRSTLARESGLGTEKVGRKKKRSTDPL